MKADLVNKMIVTLIFMLASWTNYVFASDQIKNDTAIIAKYRIPLIKQSQI